MFESKYCCNNTYPHSIQGLQEALTCQICLNPEAGPFRTPPLQQPVLLRCPLLAASPRFMPSSVWPFSVRRAKRLPLQRRKTPIRRRKMLWSGRRLAWLSWRFGIPPWRSMVASWRCSIAGWRFIFASWRCSVAGWRFIVASKRCSIARGRVSVARGRVSIARRSSFHNRPHHIDLHKHRELFNGSVLIQFLNIARLKTVLGTT